MTSKIIVYGTDANNPNILRPLQVDTSGFIIVHVDEIGGAAITALDNLHAVQVPTSDTDNTLINTPIYPGNIAAPLTGLTPSGTSTVQTAAQPTYNCKTLTVVSQIVITGTFSVVPTIQFWLAPTIYFDVLTGAAIAATPVTSLSPALNVGPGVTTVANVSAPVPLAPFFRVSYACTGTGSAVITPYALLS